MAGVELAPAAANPRQTPATVSWPVVILFTGTLSAANAFWLAAARQAVGSVPRAQHPVLIFAVLLVVLLPATATAVLMALRRSTDTEPVLRTVVRVGSFAWVVGVLAAAVEATVEYATQTAGTAQMALMHRGCEPACQAAQRAVVLGVQVRGVLLVAAVSAVTDAALIAWAAALQGGALARAGRAARGATPADAPAVGGGAGTGPILAAGLGAAALIHLAVVPEHWREWPAAGLFFVALALGQLVLAARSLRVDARIPWIVLAAAALPLALWAWSRTVGLPLGPDPWVREPVGLADLAASALELLSAAVAVSMLAARGRRRRMLIGIYGRAELVAAACWLGVLGLIGASPLSAIVWLDMGM